MVVKVKPEVAIISIGAILLALIIWLVVLWRGAVNEKEDVISISKEIIQEKKDALATEKKERQSDSTRFENNIDSAHAVYEAMEKGRRSDFYYFQNKLNDLKKVNTYDKRLSYLDSLERATTGLH